MVLRRIIVAAVAAVAATSAFAQSGAGTPAGPDQEYLRQSLAASSLALAVSRMAAEKAQTEDLKEFAELEQQEQETLAEVVKSLSAEPADVNDGTGRPLPDAEVERNLDQHGRDALEKLRAQAVGSEFDRAYMGAVSTGHLELLRIQENYLSSGPTNANAINVAKLVRTMIKEHLQLLADIESDIESDSTDAAGAASGKD